MSKQKLLLVTAGFPFGDTERGFLSEEIRQLYQQFDVYILCVGSAEPLLHPHPDEVPVERYFHTLSAKSWSGIKTLLRTALQKDVRREMKAAAQGVGLCKMLQRWKLILFYYGRASVAAVRMRELVVKEKVDLIYTYWCTEMALAGALLKQKGCPVSVITRFHGHDLFQERKKEGWQPFRRLIAVYMDRLVFACQMGQDYFLSTWGREYANKAQLYYLGCASAVLPAKAPAETLRIVSCSNLIPLKRVEYIIEGLSLLPETVKVQWDHFGDGVAQEELEVLAAEKLGENVSWCFHGRVAHHELGDWYRELDPDLFLTTSSTEGGVPVSLQEAFAMGIPAIGTAVGGIPELIFHGKTGWLLPADVQAQRVADAIMEFIRTPTEEKHAMQDRVLALWRELFDAERNACTFIDQLKALLLNREEHT